MAREKFIIGKRDSCHHEGRHATMKKEQASTDELRQYPCPPFKLSDVIFTDLPEETRQYTDHAMYQPGTIRDPS